MTVTGVAQLGIYGKVTGGGGGGGDIVNNFIYFFKPHCQVLTK